MSNYFRYAAAASLFSAISPLAYAQVKAPDVAVAPEEEGPVFLSADTLINDKANHQIIAEGNVEARASGRVLRADKVIYDLSEKYVRARGNVQIIDADGGVRYAEEIQVDESLEDGYALNFSTRLPGDAVATASAAIREGGAINSLEQMSYTACPICADSDSEPTWSLRARKAEQNNNTQMMSYQDAILEIKGVPVVYVPYFTHPDPTSQRRSGLLPPDLGASSKLGAFYEQPYFWALSPSQNLTVKPLFTSNVNPVLGLEYEKRFFSGSLNFEGSATHEADFDSDGEKFGDEDWRSHIYADGRFAINQDWKWGFGLERQSDDLYDRRYDLNGARDDRGLFTGNSRELLSQVYLVGQTNSMYSETGLLSFQGLGASADPGATPFVAPVMYTEKSFDLDRYGSLSIAGSSAVIQRDEGISSARATLDTNWRTREVFGPGFVVEPFAEARADIYNIEDTTNEYEEQTVNRTLGLAGALVSWPLMRTSNRLSVVVEPTLMAAWGTSDANNGEIPNQDALSFEADETTLFRPNGATNYDLWEGGARYSAGLSASASWGRSNTLSAIMGKRWREEADTSFNLASNLSGTQSDYVIGAALKLGKVLNFDTRLRLDEENYDVLRIDARAQTSIWRLKARAQYFSLDETLKSDLQSDEGITWKSNFRMTKHWSAVYNVDRNIADERNLKQAAGLAYQDDCSYFSFLFERSEAQDRTLGPSESFRFQFALKTLGTFGDRDFD